MNLYELTDEYFRTSTLKEIEDEEYNRTVWEGLR